MTFKQWFLKEVGFGSNCVATFSLPVGGMLTKSWPPPISDSEWKPPEKDSHKKHKKKKKED